MLGKKQEIDMITMQIEGKTVTEIAATFDLTKGRVSQILNKDENQRLKQMMIDRIALAEADKIVERRANEEPKE